MAFRFFLLFLSLISAMATTLVLISFDMSVVLATPSVADHSSFRSDFWAMGADMPSPRTDFTGAVLNGSVYIIGGFDGGGTTIGTVEFYAPKTDKWATAPQLPDALDHAAAASYDGKLYVVGGGYLETLSNKLFIYDPTTDKGQKEQICQLLEEH